ncbi:hypothetical protein [Clostridium saccharobutylicum]|uniref:HTH cro/C1-type domain-containing protein n=1 Tax=Clostridium saccharobutylicum TaxID=169679 RepID=A0A1S8MRH9_CLOSA|nr:hypothetical protein [Clostridium saccharobutylicum]OOM06794.1 hypothetical protein CLOSAC_42240 [Clostridium saccharobutylicum]
MDMPKEALEKFINDHFDGKHNECARGLNLAPSTVCRILSGNNKAGIKVITNVIKYCNEKDINYDMYINLS